MNAIHVPAGEPVWIYVTATIPVLEFGRSFTATKSKRVYIYAYRAPKRISEVAVYGKSKKTSGKSGTVWLT